MERSRNQTAFDLTIVVPCYNEAEVVEQFCAELLGVVARLDLA